MPDAVASTSLNELTRSSEAQKRPDEEDSVSIARIPQTGETEGRSHPLAHS